MTRFPVWLILVVGFSALIGLITFSGWSSLQRARNSYTGIFSLLSAEQQTVRVLGKLRGAGVGHCGARLSAGAGSRGGLQTP